MRTRPLMKGAGGLALAVTTVAGCTTFQMSTTLTRGGSPPVKVKSVTDCPAAGAGDLFVLLGGPPPELTGEYGATMGRSDDRAWQGTLQGYTSVVTEPMKPDPVVAPNNYVIQPQCVDMAANDKVTQTYDPQTLHVLPALTFAAPTGVRRGNAIRMSGAGCTPGNTVLAGALLLNQPWYAWNDGRLIKYFTTSKADRYGRWSVNVTIPSSAHTGPYRLRAECQFSNGAVGTGYAPAPLNVGY